MSWIRRMRKNLAKCEACEAGVCSAHRPDDDNWFWTGTKEGDDELDRATSEGLVEFLRLRGVVK